MTDATDGYKHIGIDMASGPDMGVINETVRRVIKEARDEAIFDAINDCITVKATEVKDD